ncbi:MAG: S41 family peptidase [Odoribacter sp.]
MNLIKIIFTGLCLLVFTGLMAQENPLWMRYPAISPDGKTIAFCYKGDIFLVATEGGKATQLTTHPAYDGRPTWSPDSKTIAFASARDGGMNLYTVPTSGGTPTRLTFYSGGEMPVCFTPNGKEIIYRANVMPESAYGQFPSSGQVYKVSVNGGRPERFLTFDASDICFNEKGDQIVYHDYKGYEDNWRKHHQSSVCRDIWLHDLNTNQYTNLTHQQVEDRTPIFADHDQSLYFLSERFGDFNVCKMELKNPSAIQQITKHSKHPVRFLTKSKNDILCYFFNGEIYTLQAGKQAKKVSIQIVADDMESPIAKMSMNRGASEFSISPDGEEFALIIRGDVFVANAEFGTTKRITNTPTQERSVEFSADGRSLVYAGERDGHWNIYVSRIKNKDDKSFTYAKEIEEEQITKGKNACFQPSFSPDGKEIAYLENRTEIKVIEVKNKKARTVLPGKYNYSYTDGDQWYQWSPDGKWILAKYFEKGGWQHNDVALVKADGSGEIHNLTNSGYSDQNPKWMMNGKAIIWMSDRQGMRSHGSWGAEYDIYALFLDTEAWDEFQMDKEELALAKEMKNLQKKKEAEEKAAAEKKEKKDKKKDKEEDKKSATDKKEKELPELKIDFENLEDRIVRLTLNSSRLGDAVLTNDASKLYYLSAFEGGYDLWVRDFKNGSTRILSKINRGGGALQMDKEGKNLYLLSGGQISKIDLNSGQLKGMDYKADFELKKPEERAYLFDHVWQQVADKFYDPSIHNINWAFYKNEYARFLPYINNNYDFAEMLGEMLGELNASHTGANYRGGGSPTQTANFGAFMDEQYEGNGLKIKEILDKGPLNFSNSKIKNGDVILKINNQTIEKGKDYFHLLEDLEGERVMLTMYDPTTKKEWDEYVKPISSGKQNELLYERWITQRKEMVEKLSNGKIGYVHIKSMDSPSFRKVYAELLGRYRNKEAIVVDTRYNSGGWLHEDLLHLLSGKKYAEFVPRGQFIGEDPFTQWNKPSAVIISESNYSNAHGFPWAYKELKLGKLVGMPVPGTMTAVWWENLMDPSLVFGIPQVGMKDNQGRILENMQLEPDIQVTNDPENALKGRDLQLEAAVESLMKEIK